MVGIILRHGVFWVSGGSSFSKFFTKAPMGRFFLEKFFKGVAYKKFKVEDSKDLEI